MQNVCDKMGLWYPDAILWWNQIFTSQIKIYRQELEENITLEVDQRQSLMSGNTKVDSFS